MVLKHLSRFFFLVLISGSCCPFVKEEHLGHNLYLSEYDVEDRIILYSEDVCSGSGVLIVPMTVSRYNYDSDWIIAASNASTDTLQYWIINIDYENEPSLEEIRSNIRGPLDKSTFEELINKEGITLSLKNID